MTIGWAPVVVVAALGLATSLLPAAWAAPLGPSSGSVTGRALPPPTTSAATSTNWSGYAVLSPLGSATRVYGEWHEPAYHGTCGATASNGASTWVGLDGYVAHSYLEAAGTNVSCFHGRIAYNAWYELRGVAAGNFSLAIAPGDQIFTEVLFNSTNGRLTFRVADLTSGVAAGTVRTLRTVPLSSAEWIVSAPVSARGVQPLADFSSVGFTQCLAKLAKFASPVGTFNNLRITMVFVHVPVSKKATAGSITKGVDFTVKWVAAGP
ncbi:MAG TPA: G1 family glutamic endopeptidase [Thermoplasmata archaeon]|nr:G1 family glutamic endopeptidase [Thermoplasmata archaeon]